MQSFASIQHSASRASQLIIRRLAGIASALSSVCVNGMRARVCVCVRARARVRACVRVCLLGPALALAR
jgi:hypothetical protein